MKFSPMSLQFASISYSATRGDLPLVEAVAGEPLAAGRRAASASGAGLGVEADEDERAPLLDGAPGSSPWSALSNAATPSMSKIAALVGRDV